MTLAERLYQIDEPYAAGIFERENADRKIRLALGQYRYWEKSVLPEYNGKDFYPCGNRFAKEYAVYPYFSSTYYVDEFRLEKKDKELCQIAKDEFFTLKSLVFNKKLERHLVGGDGFSHSIPNYKRIAEEGLNSYAKRVENIADRAFKESLKIILDGIRLYHKRCIEYLTKQNAKQELLTALKVVPFEPAQNLYQAMVCWNFIYYIDFCDNPGRLDADLFEFYKGENAEDWFRQFFLNVDANDGWTAALGPDYNPLTLQCLRAIRGIRRPNLELRVTKSMPQEVWNEAKETLLSGTGHPSLYNEELYQSSLAKFFPEIPLEDLKKFCGGGCTETMFAGISHVGSLDAGINLLYEFSNHLRNFQGNSFEEFYKTFLLKIAEVVKIVCDELNRYQKDREEFRPQPVRSLLIDDCIDKGKDFNGGGARWHFSIINFAGLINTIDSLLAIKEIVYQKKLYSPNDFIAKLDKNDLILSQQLKQCHFYGVGDEIADRFANEFTTEVISQLKQYKPYLGGKFVASSIQFTTYVNAGKDIPATPDGRKADAPLADSLSAILAKDTKGLLPMLRSVTSLPLSEMIGTPVLNLKIQKSYLEKSFEGIIKGYFKDGGMQVQINCLSREDMIKALDNPQNYQNLIVRTGGYAEYFVNLERPFQQTLIDRTEIEN